MYPTLITSLFFIIPLYFLPLQYCKFLFYILHISTFFSLYFWYNPIKNTYIHKIDAFLLKLQFFLLYFINFL